MAFIPIETWWRVSVNVSSCHLSQMAFALSQLNIPFSEIFACWRQQSREPIDGIILGFYISPLAAAAQPWIPVSWTGSSSKLPPTDRRSELNIGQFVSFIEVLVQQASRRLLHVDLGYHPRTTRWKLPDKGQWKVLFLQKTREELVFPGYCSE